VKRAYDDADDVLRAPGGGGGAVTGDFVGVEESDKSASKSAGVAIIVAVVV
jgi:hypothetical protein